MKLVALMVVLVSGCAAMGIITPKEQRRRDALAQQQAEKNEAERQETIRQMHRQEARDSIARVCAPPETSERQQMCLQARQEEIRLDLEQQQIDAIKRGQDMQDKQQEAARRTKCTTTVIGDSAFTKCR